MEGLHPEPLDPHERNAGERRHDDKARRRDIRRLSARGELNTKGKGRERHGDGGRGSDGPQACPIENNSSHGDR